MSSAGLRTIGNEFKELLNIQAVTECRISENAYVT